MDKLTPKQHKARGIFLIALCILCPIAIPAVICYACCVVGSESDAHIDRNKEEIEFLRSKAKRGSVFVGPGGETIIEC